MKFLIDSYELRIEEEIPISAKAMNSGDFWDIFDEAARHFYWALGGYEFVWPMYFHASADDGELLASADIYIVSPHDNILFDIVLK